MNKKFYVILPLFIFLMCSFASNSVSTGTKLTESIIHTINQYRNQANKSSLKHDKTFGETARSHARDMANENYFSSRSPSGTTPLDRVRDHTPSFLGNVSQVMYKYSGINQNKIINRLENEWFKKNDLPGFFEFDTTTRVGMGIHQSQRRRATYIVIYAGFQVDNTNSYLATVRNLIHDKVNRFRINQGLDPLKRDYYFHKASKNHVNNMITNDFFAHSDPSGRGALQRLNEIKTGYAEKMLENLGYHTPLPANDLAQAIVRGWKQSPGHRKNMLTEGVIQSGVAVDFHVKKNLIYVVHNFGNKR